MTKTISTIWRPATAILLCVPLIGGAAYAQEAQSKDQAERSADQMPQDGADQASDAVVATVGEAQIRGSDVMTFVGALPPQLQSQPPQMLLPMALEQLVLRELILEDARGQNLADDPEVVALVGSTTQVAEEDAMVQVWLDRAMTDVVTDEAVQQAYEDAQAQGQQDLPPLEEVRPQIEQYLRQQAMQDVVSDLRQDAEVVFYDATGRPTEQQAGQSGQQGQDAQGAGDDAAGDADGSGDTEDGDASDGASGSSDTSGTATPKN